MLQTDVRVSGMWLKMPAIFQVILYGVHGIILNCFEFVWLHIHSPLHICCGN